MAVHGSGHSLMVHGSGPSMSVAHGGGGAGLVGPLQDKLNRLLLNAHSPAKSSGHGSLIAAGRYDNLSSSLSHSVKVMHGCHQEAYTQLLAACATPHLLLVLAQASFVRLCACMLTELMHAANIVIMLALQRLDRERQLRTNINVVVH